METLDPRKGGSLSGKGIFGPRIRHPQRDCLSACKRSRAVQALQSARMMFEAHSTDYQTRQALRCPVFNRFAISKIGSGQTLALRQALYCLDLIAAFLEPMHVQ
jgi:tagatose-1,6-bisphosphate aldolase non-catalytic subunit AgaZ/GatZ